MPVTDPFAVDWYQIQDNYAILASGVLWTIDYIDTLPMEISILWNRSKVTLTAILYFVGRYCMLFYAYVRVSYLARGTVTDEFCADISYPTTAALQLGELCTNTLLLLRAYAIYHKSPIILILGIAIILGRCVHGLYINFTLEVPVAGLDLPFYPRCTWIRPNDSHKVLFQRSVFVTPTLVLALHTLIFAAIITPTLGLVLDMRKHRCVGLMHRVVRDSVLHYVVILGLATCLAAANIAASSGKGTNAINSLGQIIVPFFNLVPNILASRIYLNTHVYANSDYSSTATLTRGPGKTLSSLGFATRIMGSIGAPLRSELCGDSFGSDSNAAQAPEAHSNFASEPEPASGEMVEMHTIQHENIMNGFKFPDHNEVSTA